MWMHSRAPCLRRLCFPADVSHSTHFTISFAKYMAACVLQGSKPKDKRQQTKIQGGKQLGLAPDADSAVAARKTSCLLGHWR